MSRAALRERLRNADLIVEQKGFWVDCEDTRPVGARVNDLIDRSDVHVSRLLSALMSGRLVFRRRKK